MRTAPLLLLPAVGAALFLACGSDTGTTFPPGTTFDGSTGADSGPPPIVIDTDGGTTGTQDAGIGKECATGKTGTRRLPGYIQLVLDGSGSMANNGKWNAVKAAVDTVVAKWVAEGDASFGAGVSAFADSKDPTGAAGPYPSSVDVSIAVVNAAQQAKVTTRLSGNASGGTPSNKALTGNYTYLRGFDPATAGLPAGGQKIVVFMSDGAPTDCGSAPYASCTALPTAAVADGIRTYAVLFADSGTNANLRRFMNDIAKNGGGLANPNCDPASTTPSKYCHYEIDTAAGNSAAIARAFADAINQARSSIDPCTLAIEQQPGQPFDPGLVNVTITDGAGTKSDVYKDPANGWSYDDPANPTKVVLHGTSCDKVKDDPKASVELILGCPSQDGSPR